MAAAFLMSVKPVFLERILAGTKHYELRRSRVRFSGGDLVILYASQPVKGILGAFTVARVHRGPPAELWSARGEYFGITRQEYDEYLHGCESACAIEIEKRTRVSIITLDELRRSFAGFQPPQSYSRWLSDPTGLIGRQATEALAWNSEEYGS